MIYTVTCNPALDLAVRLDGLQIGGLNRTAGATLIAGGKGVNVSRVLGALGERNKALGFVAGGNGVMLESALQQMGVHTDFIRLPEGQTRINVKLYGEQETELNSPGPVVSHQQVEGLLKDLSRLQEGDLLCLCGSLPPGMGTDSYARMLKAAEGVRAIVDTTGEALLCALAEKPWLVKPNQDELAALVGRELPTIEDVIEAAQWLRERGAENVLVSMGKDGALLCAEGTRLYQPAPDGKVIGTVGAGDSLVAGFAAGWQRYGDRAQALRLGVACGSATACSEGLADGEGVEQMLAKMPAMKEI